MSRKSEREAAAKAAEVLKRAGKAGYDVGGDYGAGKLTKAQKKSQERHIPFTPAPRTTAGRIARKLWG